MPYRPCPQCGTLAARRLEYSSAIAWVNYFRCEECGHVSTTPKPRHEPRLGASFLRTEIGAGMTFASLAIAAGADSPRRARHRANAQAAYEAVVRYVERIALTADEAVAIRASLATLKTSIDAIPASHDQQRHSA